MKQRKLTRAIVMASASTALGLLPATSIAEEADNSGRRQIEEITVTAEKVESTVSDTSISITAFDGAMLEDFGLQGADDLMDFTPATTRDEYDVRIRGVGRNFRALGGDPGVATYYNGIYSPDFGIAASENALYDLERVEVLRGPQGTLYGRNSVGGAINYVTKKPSYEPEAEIRTQFGRYATQEYYGMLSGPLLDDRLATRVTAVKRDRNGSQKGKGFAPDVNSIDDQNLALSLQWDITDTFSWYIRGNDRKSDRRIGSGLLIDEGFAPNRGVRSTNLPVFGVTTRGGTVTAGTPGAMSFFNPRTGLNIFAAPNRPGLDPVGFPYAPNPAFGRNPDQILPVGSSFKDPDRGTQVNDDGNCDQYPYTRCNSNHELFDHTSFSSEMNWEINDTMALKYLYGYQTFDYTFNQDIDYVDSGFSAYRQTVLESVYSYSHELQLDWAIGDRLTATSGVYWFKEQRNQDYSLTNSTARFIQPANYGALDTRVGFLGGASITDLLFASSPLGANQHARLGSAPVGKSNFGRWLGDERGDVYEHLNQVDNEAFAVYTQGTFEFNEKLALVAGLRYAKDKKAAEEVRGGYFELDIPWAAGFMGFIPGGTFPNGGLTLLGATNVSMGAATRTGNPADPLRPVCAIDDGNCARPLRLAGGVPISYSSSVKGDDSWDDINFRVNLDWTPTDDILMYFSVTTGYRAGGYQLGVTDARDNPRDANGLPLPGTLLTPLTYDKETITAYEIGYKGFHFDRTVQIIASIYQYDYKGYQDRIDILDETRGRSVDVVINADKAINRGFEMEALWYPTQDLTIGANYSYTDAFYDSSFILIDTGNPEFPLTVFGGVSLTNPNNSFLTHDVKGDQLKGIPEHKATVWANYDIPTDMGVFSVRGSYSYTGDYVQRGINSKYDLLPERFRMDLSGQWVSLDRDWTVRVFVDNVFDEKNLRSISPGSQDNNFRTTGSELYPRYYGVDIKYHIGG